MQAHLTTSRLANGKISPAVAIKISACHTEAGHKLIAEWPKAILWKFRTIHLEHPDLADESRAGGGNNLVGAVAIDIAQRRANTTAERWRVGKELIDDISGNRINDGNGRGTPGVDVATSNH